MAGSGGRVGRGVLVVVLLLGGSVTGSSRVAAAEEQSRTLPGTTLNALTADLDGDGEREIVRLLQGPDGVDKTIDAWDHDGTGWSIIGSTPMARVPEGSEAEASPPGDAVGLLRWVRGGRDGVLALSAALQPDDENGSTCCLTISEVLLSPGGRLEIQPMQRVGGGAQSMQVADFDADGNDELLLQEVNFTEERGAETATLTVLRWTGSAFEELFKMTDEQVLYGYWIGESDGVAGDDLVFPPSSDGSMRRLAWESGELRWEETHVEVGAPPNQGWISGIADGAIVLSLPDGVEVTRWPRAEKPVTVGRLPTTSLPGVSLVGDGADALVLTHDAWTPPGHTPSITVHDLPMRRLGQVVSGATATDFWSLYDGPAGREHGLFGARAYTYFGPLADAEVDGRPAFLFGGFLIQAGGALGFEARPMATLVGVQSFGLAGPADGWVLTSDGYGAPTGAAYLSWGQVPPGWGRLTVTPLTSLLLPDSEVAGMRVALSSDAVEIKRKGSNVTLVADGDGFVAEISAPPGSRLLVRIDARVEEHAVAGEPILLEIEPPPAGDEASEEDAENEEFEVLLLSIGPDGRGMSERWTGTFVREPPELTVGAETTSMAFSATLEGVTSPGSAVTANGVPVEVDAEGRFAASVDAPIWPSQVSVIARDPLGNEVMEQVEIVGVVDYRALPWAAILIVATLGVGAALYVRTPKRRALAGAESEGDGRLEELELEGVEGAERGLR